MVFKDEETDEHMFYRKVSEDGRVEIGVCPVMYGFRIRAGFTGSGCYELDYCAGDKDYWVKLIYQIVLMIIADRLSKGETNPFKGFPHQEVKPMNNDPDCFAGLVKMTEAVTIEKIEVEIPLIHEMKRAYMDKLFSKKK